MTGQDSTLKRSVAKHALILGLFALAAALLTGLVNRLTEDAIRQQRQAAERRALLEVMPAAAFDNDLLAESFVLGPATPGYARPDLLGLREPATAYVARRGEEVSGVILPALSRSGYSGDIALLVGVRADGSLSGVRVLGHRETPGLGDKIETRVSDWILGFEGRSLDDPPAPRWQVRKDGGDFDQFVGATITPRAVVRAVADALAFFDANRERLLMR